MRRRSLTWTQGGCNQWTTDSEWCVGCSAESSDICSTENCDACYSRNGQTCLFFAQAGDNDANCSLTTTIATSAYGLTTPCYCSAAIGSPVIAKTGYFYDSAN